VLESDELYLRLGYLFDRPSQLKDVQLDEGTNSGKGVKISITTVKGCGGVPMEMLTV